MTTTSNSFIDCKVLVESKTFPTAEFHGFVLTQKQNSHSENVRGMANKFLYIQLQKKITLIII